MLYNDQVSMLTHATSQNYHSRCGPCLEVQGDDSFIQSVLKIQDLTLSSL